MAAELQSWVREKHISHQKHQHQLEEPNLQAFLKSGSEGYTSLSLTEGAADPGQSQMEPRLYYSTRVMKACAEEPLLPAVRSHWQFTEVLPYLMR